MLPGRVLEDELGLAPIGRSPAFDVGSGEPSNLIDACRQRLQSEHGPSERRLAAPALADQRDDLAGVDTEIDAVDRLHRQPAAPARRIGDLGSRDMQQRCAS